MKGILVLAGGGNEKQSFETDKYFINLIDRRKPILYIPLAMPENVHPYKECLEWIKKVFSQFNYSEIEMWTDLHRKNLETLKEFSAIYLGGGNTFNLLNYLRITGFDKILKKYFEQGGIIYGGSAGAIILGKNIKTAEEADENEPKLTSLKALNLCSGYSIWCHYKQKDKTEIEKLCAEGLKIIAIPENASVVVKENLIAIGPGKPKIFENEQKREIHPL